MYRCFAEAPYSMAAYDRVVQYQRRSTEASQVQGVSISLTGTSRLSSFWGVPAAFLSLWSVGLHTVP